MTPSRWDPVAVLYLLVPALESTTPKLGTAGEPELDNILGERTSPLSDVDEECPHQHWLGIGAVYSNVSGLVQVPHGGIQVSLMWTKTRIPRPSSMCLRLICRFLV